MRKSEKTWVGHDHGVGFPKNDGGGVEDETSRQEFSLGSVFEVAGNHVC